MNKSILLLTLVAAIALAGKPIQEKPSPPYFRIGVSGQPNGTFIYNKGLRPIWIQPEGYPDPVEIVPGAIMQIDSQPGYRVIPIIAKPEMVLPTPDWRVKNTQKLGA